MKASELIARLAAAIEAHGDFDVHLIGDADGWQGAEFPAIVDVQLSIRDMMLEADSAEPFFLIME